MSKQSLLDTPTNTLKVISLENNTKRGRWAREILQERAEAEKAMKSSRKKQSSAKTTRKKTPGKTTESDANSNEVTTDTQKEGSNV